MPKYDLRVEGRSLGVFDLQSSTSVKLVPIPEPVKLMVGSHYRVSLVSFNHGPFQFDGVMIGWNNRGEPLIARATGNLVRIWAVTPQENPTYKRLEQAFPRFVPTQLTDPNEC